MDRRTRALAIALVLLAGLTFGCLEDETDINGVGLSFSEVVAVDDDIFGTNEEVAKAGESKQIHVFLDWATESGASPDEVSQEEEEALTDPAKFTWAVAPAKGASVSKAGVFKADEPGIYTVTAAGSPGSASLKVEVERGVSPLVGTWEFENEYLDTVEGEKTKTIRFTVTQDATGRLSAKWDYGTTGDATHDPKTGKVVVDCGFKTDYSFKCVGTLSGDSIVGKQDYSGSASGGRLESIVGGKAVTYDFNQPWDAKRVE